MAERSVAADVLHALHEDYETIRQKEGKFAAARTLAGAALTATATVPYLLGGLEATVAAGGAEAYNLTHNIAAVAATNGAISGIVESGLTLAIGHYMGRATRTAEVFERRQYETDAVAEADAALQTDTTHEAVATRGLLARAGQRIKNGTETALLAMGAGSPGIMLHSYVHHPEEGVAAHRRKGFKTAGMLAGVNVAIGAVYGTLLDTVIPESWITTLKNPLVWLGGYIGLKTIGPALQAEKTAWDSIGRAVTFRGDAANYQQLAATLTENQQILSKLPTTKPTA